MQLYEMAKVNKQDTKLPYDLWIDSIGKDRKNTHYLPRIKVEVNNKQIPVLIDEHNPDIPDSVKKKGIETFKDIQKIKEYIKVYYDVFMKHWNREISDREALNQLNSLEARIQNISLNTKTFKSGKSYSQITNKEIKEDMENRKLNLTEGYIGQTVNDFLDDVAGLNSFDLFYLANINDDEYNPDKLENNSDVRDKYGDKDFVEFDTMGGGLLINVIEPEDEGLIVSEWFETVQDVLDCCNEDYIEIDRWNSETNEYENLFAGDISELEQEHEELLDLGFLSLDTTEGHKKQLSITYSSDEDDDYEEDEEDIDESLQESTDIIEFKVEYPGKENTSDKTFKRFYDLLDKYNVQKTNKHNLFKIDKANFDNLQKEINNGDTKIFSLLIQSALEDEKDKEFDKRFMKYSNKKLSFEEFEKLMDDMEKFYE